MIKDLNLMEGQEDLRIVEHLDMHKLPESGQRLRLRVRAYLICILRMVRREKSTTRTCNVSSWRQQQAAKASRTKH